MTFTIFYNTLLKHLIDNLVNDHMHSLQYSILNMIPNITRLPRSHCRVHFPTQRGRCNCYCTLHLEMPAANIECRGMTIITGTIVKDNIHITVFWVVICAPTSSISNNNSLYNERNHGLLNIH